jgi:hypothetical protein
MKLFTVNSKNERSTIYILESDSISGLKDEIKKKYNITNDLEILYNGQILEDQQKISEIPINDEETIQFNEIFKAGK